QPVGESYRAQPCIAIGNERIFGYLSSEVAEARIGDYLAWIVSGFEKLSCQLVQLPSVRPGHVDVAVLWSLKRNLRYRGCDVIGGDRLHEHVREMNRSVFGSGIGQAADEFKELRCAHNRVRDTRGFDRLFLRDLGSHITDVAHTVCAYDGKRNVMPDSSCRFNRE